MGCIEAITPSSARRLASSGWMSWTCSMRWRRRPGTSRRAAPVCQLAFVRTQLGKCLQDFVVGSIADGVYRQAEPAGNCLAAVLVQLLGVQQQHAAVLWLAGVRRQHGCRARTQCAVGECLHRADPQVIIPKPAVQPEPNRVREIVPRDALHYPQSQLSCSVQLLERHETPPAVKIVHPGQPHPPQARNGALDCLFDLLEGRLRDCPGSQAHGALKQDAGRAALRGSFQPPASRVRSGWSEVGRCSARLFTHAACSDLAVRYTGLCGAAWSRSAALPKPSAQLFWFQPCPKIHSPAGVCRARAGHAARGIRHAWASRNPLFAG